MRGLAPSCWSFEVKLQWSSEKRALSEREDWDKNYGNENMVLEWVKDELIYSISFSVMRCNLNCIEIHLKLKVNCKMRNFVNIFDN